MFDVAAAVTTQQALLRDLALRESFGMVGAINPLTTATQGHPFYLVHSITGKATDFNRLALAIGDDLRLNAIATPSRLRNGRFVSSVVAAARYYVEAIIRHQPEGPLSVGGWSAGSIVALEVAQQLEARGRNVSMLFVLDGLPRNAGTVPGRLDPRYYYKVATHLPQWYAGLREDNPDQRLLGMVREKLFKFGEIFVQRANGTAGSRDPIKDFAPFQNYLPAHQDYIRCFHAAAEAYVPRRYAGAVTVYQAMKAPLRPPYVDESWKHLAPQAVIVPIHADHVTLVIGDDVMKLAGPLRVAMQSVQARHPHVPALPSQENAVAGSAPARMLIAA